MATKKFKKKDAEKRSYKRKDEVLKVSFDFISKLKTNINRLQDRFLNLFG